MSRGMTDVQLVDDDAAAPPPTAPSPPRAPARRGRWWLLAAAALVVGCAVGAQVLLDARERAHVARFDDLPGILLPLAARPGALWELPAEEDRQVVTEAGGHLVSASVSQDGVTVTGLDRATGAPAWTARADARVDLVADEPWVHHAQCAPLDDDRGRATRVACVAGASQVNELTDGTEPVQVVVVDARTGALVSSVRRDAWGHAWATRGGDLLLVTGDAGAQRVTAVGADGGTRWETALQAEGGAVGLTEPAVSARGGFALVSAGDHAWVLDEAGAVVREHAVPADTSVMLGRGGALVLRGYTRQEDAEDSWSYQSDAHALFVGQDGTQTVVEDVALPDTDDGSAPGVELMLDGQTGAIVGRAAADGRELWRARASGYPHVLLERTIYVQQDGELVALDVGTGDERWSAHLAEPGWQVVTDGRLVYAIGPEGSVQGFTLDRGEQRYQADLGEYVDPESGAYVQLWNGMLISWERGLAVG